MADDLDDLVSSSSSSPSAAGLSAAEKKKQRDRDRQARLREERRRKRQGAPDPVASSTAEELGKELEDEPDDDDKPEPLTETERKRLKEKARRQLALIHKAANRRWPDPRWELSKEELDDYAEDALPIMERHLLARSILGGNMYVSFVATFGTIEEQHAFAVMKEKGLLGKPEEPSEEKEPTAFRKVEPAANGNGESTLDRIERLSHARG